MPGPRNVTVGLGIVVLDNVKVGVPLICVHVPDPDEGVFAERTVDARLHKNWSGPALAIEALGLTATVKVDGVPEQPLKVGVTKYVRVPVVVTVVLIV